MYRAVTLYAMQQGIITQNSFDQQQLINDLKNIYLTFQFNETLGFAEMYLNDVNVENEIRSMEVSALVSKIAAVSEVRSKLVQQQKLYGQHKGVVMDGRDIGTVVFPDAELKIFMTASAEVRAKRRFDELIAKGENVTFGEILHNVQERDHIDSTREDSPLIKADDAIEVDNSHMSLEEQYIIVNRLVQEVLVKGSK